MKQNKRIPRISTRGFYDLASGKTLKKIPYDLYPKKFFEELGNYPEFTIMIHGLRNNKKDALAKFRIAQKRLGQLGYNYPIVGFSYDSNTTGIQYKSAAIKATKIGRIIARKNGRNLANFILDFKKKSAGTKIRLLGHSLGTEVIVHTLAEIKNKKDVVEAVYFFGSSVPEDFLRRKSFGRILQKTIKQKILNYFNPHDDVLKYAYEHKIIERPLGYRGATGRQVSKYAQKRLGAKNHRFASYSLALKSYP